jgi:hypothetical protein
VCNPLDTHGRFWFDQLKRPAMGDHVVAEYQLAFLLLSGSFTRGTTMEEVLKGVLTAPVATLLIVFGMLFLLIAVVGNISGKIEPGVPGRLASGVLGIALVLTGLTMHFSQNAATPAQTPAERVELDPATVPPDKGAQTPIAATGQSVGATPNADGQGSERPGEAVVSDPEMADHEPNDQITAARSITAGTRIHGALATKQDRDFYKFQAPSSATRVILRKLSLPGFGGTVVVYDGVERRVAGDTEFGDTPISFAFESVPDAFYYVVVKPYNYDYRGDYELVIQKE